jgi:hypothetical protein
MSTTTEGREAIDLQAIVARIERDLAESRKLREESEKFVAERRKLDSESLKLDRDRWLAPALAIAAVIGGLLGVASFIAHLMGH